MTNGGEEKTERAQQEAPSPTPSFRASSSLSRTGKRVGFFLTKPLRSTALRTGLAGFLRGAVTFGSRAILALGGSLAGIPAGTLAILIAIAVTLPLFFALFNQFVRNAAFVGLGGGTGPLPGQSSYLAVAKFANPSTFAGPLPTSIEYTVTLAATQENLFNITVNEEFTAINESGSLPPPPVSLPTFPSSLAAGESFTDSFSVTYGPQYQDSLVTNRITVRADVEGGPSGEEASTSVTVQLGNAPQDCPSGWPTPTGYITQGPGRHSGRTGAQAIDIGVIQLFLRDDVSKALSIPALASHKGIVHVGYGHRVFGNNVTIEGTCKIGDSVVQIRTLYAHLSLVSVKQNQTVTRGEELGYIGTSGESSGVHLHYEFVINLPMAPPYIPEEVPDSCGSRAACGNINW